MCSRHKPIHTGQWLCLNVSHSSARWPKVEDTIHASALPSIIKWNSNTMSIKPLASNRWDVKICEGMSNKSSDENRIYCEGMSNISPDEQKLIHIDTLEPDRPSSSRHPLRYILYCSRLPADKKSKHQYKDIDGFKRTTIGQLLV